MTNENKHIKLGNMVTCVTGTKKKREEDKGKDAEYSNKHWRDRKMDRMSTYTTKKGRGWGKLPVEHKNKKEINITLQTEGLKNKRRKIKTKV